MNLSLFLKFGAKTAVAFVIAVLLTQNGAAQNVAPKKEKIILPVVKQIDINGLKSLLQPNGKPLLINFWATWCEPCREEFPDLVRIDEEFRGKIDFITVSLDDLADIKTHVPKFLKETNAKMPAYLLRTPDESAAIKMVSASWPGNLPMTILFNPDGSAAYSRNGKIRYEGLKAEIDRLFAPASTTKDGVFVVMDFVKVKEGRRNEALYYYENNWKIYRVEAKKQGVIDSFELIEARSETNTAFDLILVTRYKGEEKFLNSEKNFEPILKELRPDGAKLLNSLKPEEFRQNVFLYQGRSIIPTN
ncbi:MAG: TlpA family protein disulfide reductase [Pyrinomonadaceae bacterium]